MSVVSIFHDTPLGTLELAASEYGLTRCEFVDDQAGGWPPDGEVLDTLERASPPAPHHLSIARQELERYFAGGLHRFSVPLDQGATAAFDRAVYAGLDAAAPFATTTSYASLANALGLEARRTRRICTVVRRNRMLIVRPCHRVLDADGSMSDYAGGAYRKAFLIALEATSRGG